MTEAVVCRCGGSFAQHQNDRACWCPNCLSGADSERCASFTPETSRPKPPKPDVDRAVVRVGADHPKTSHDAAAKAKPNSGTVRRLVYDHIAQSGARGATDDEIEKALGRSHQSVSGARNTLFNDDLIRDSGQRRKTRYSNDAIAWVVTDISDQADALAGEESPLDLTAGPVVEVSEGQAVVRDGSVTLVVPTAATSPVRVTIGDDLHILLNPEHREDLWDAITSEFAEAVDLDRALQPIYAAIHQFSQRLKKEGR